MEDSERSSNKMNRLIYEIDKNRYKIIKKKFMPSKNYLSVAVNDSDKLSTICETMNYGMPRVMLKRMNTINEDEVTLKRQRKDSLNNIIEPTSSIIDSPQHIKLPVIQIERLDEKNFTTILFMKNSLQIEKNKSTTDSASCNIEPNLEIEKDIGQSVLSGSVEDKTNLPTNLTTTTNDNESSSTRKRVKISDSESSIGIDFNGDNSHMDLTVERHKKKFCSGKDNAIADVEMTIDGETEIKSKDSRDKKSVSPKQNFVDDYTKCNNVTSSCVISEEISRLPSLDVVNDNDLVNPSAVIENQFNDVNTHLILDNKTLAETLVDLNHSSDFPSNIEEKDILIIDGGFLCEDIDLYTENSVFLNKTNFDRVFEQECNNLQLEGSHPSGEFVSPEDDLLETVIVPNTDQKYVNDDDDLANYESTYEISDQLENILSSQLESETIEIIRNNSEEVTDNNNLSFPNLRYGQPINYRTNADFSSENNSANTDSSDFDFDPQKVSHSSTVLEDTLSRKQLSKSVKDVSIEAENLSPQVSLCTSNVKKTVIDISTSIKIPLPSKGSCDNSKLTVESSNVTDDSGTTTFLPRWKKKYFCIYCNKLVVKLPRHIETVHKDIVEAQQLKNTPKGTQERKKLMEIYRDNGRTMHNTNPEYNTGKLLVSRRPRSENKSADLYTTCAKCLKPVTKSNSYKHFAVCVGAKTHGAHSYKFLGRYVEGRIHATASDTLSLVIFPVFQEDTIVRLIRYDWLLILYGNKLCIKHTPHYQHNLIRAKLRLVGRLLYAAKEINAQVEDLASIFAPEYIDTIVKAIEVVARINRVDNDCGAPSSALNLVTYLKHIRKMYESELAKKNDKEGLDRVMRFKKVYKNEMPDSINKIAMEAQSKLKRQKVVILPMTEDIKKLIEYLKAERKRCFKILELSFNLLEWLNCLKLVAVYILVFNRRRVGDIQNMLLSDLNKIECIDKDADQEEFNLLDDTGKAIAKKFFRIAIRGKKNRTVAVIVGADIIKDINILIRHRLSANVPLRNEYLFGLPNNIDDRIRVINICKEMRDLSVACGAKKPELLRGTELRKHVATKCIELELNDKALGDVINHMGHSEKIHKDFYQQPIKSKTIVQVAKVLEAVQGPLDLDEDEIGLDDLSDFIVISDQVREKEINEYSVNFTEPSCSHDVNDFNLSKPSSSKNKKINVEYDSVEKNVSLEKESNDYVNRDEIKQVPEAGKIQRKRWSQMELNIVNTAFQHHLQAGTLPSLSEIDGLMDKYSCLHGRSRLSIKTWVSNKLKSKPKNSTSVPRIVSNKKVHMDVDRYLTK